MKNPFEILKNFWGYDSFIYPQDEIIKDVLDNKDVIALLPTGFGKSVTFQIPILAKEKGICLVISPLIALINDQVDQLHKKGLKAVAISGFLSINEQIRIFDNLLYGDVRFLYIAPERLQSEFFIEKLKQLDIKHIAIDEAHCISEWGHDFRPAYLKIQIIREIFPDANIIALTATATEKVIEDINKYLHLKKPSIFIKSLVRENIAIKIAESSDKIRNLVQVLHNEKRSVIVYAGTRKNVENTCKILNNKNINSVYYHAGLTKIEKEKAYQNWMSNQNNIIVATNAFGMGIDKPDVRKVIHISLPNSIENYIQEIGRAGRDGNTSEAILIEDSSELVRMSELYFNTLPTLEFIKKMYLSLIQYYKIPYGELPSKYFIFDINHFASQYNLPLAKTFHTLEIFERQGILNWDLKSDDFHFIRIYNEESQLFDYYKRNPTKEKLLHTILRKYEGVTENLVPINPYDLAKLHQIGYDELIKQIIEMNKDNIIEYQYHINSNKLKFLQPREDNYTINRIQKEIIQNIENKKKKYNSMVNFVLNKQQCRNVQIAHYFGDFNAVNCMICDVCIDEKKPENLKIEKELLKILNTTENMSVSQVFIELEYTEKEILNTIRKLADDGKIRLISHSKICKI